jgi:hypothetical protein
MAIELKITMDDAGHIGLSGPLQNIIMVYGLLEAAKDALRAHMKQNESLIQPATLVPPKFPGMS